MYRRYAYFTDVCLVIFDLTVSVSVYFAVLWGTTNRAEMQHFTQFSIASEHVHSLGWILLLWLACSLYFRAYHSRRMDTPFADLQALLKVGLACFFVLEGIARIAPSLDPAPDFLPLFVALNCLVLATVKVAARLALRELRRRGRNVKHLVLVSFPELGERVAQKIERRSHYGYHIARHILYSHSTPEDRSRVWEEFQMCLQSIHVDDVILALPAEARDLTARLLAECENWGINVRVVPDLFPLVQADTQIYDLDGIPIINARLYPTDYWCYAVLKRSFDVVVSLAVLILLSPLFLVIAILIKLTSPGPTLFIQDRVGLNGRQFKMLKFRTMHLRATSESNTHWTTPDDPNVTRLGRWLRKTNLDELPQFFNVLKGDMSIVGPRPERPFFLERFRREFPGYMLRHYVKCGITGWAQVNGWRGDTSISERITHDLYYIRNWALAFDLKIVVLTVAKSFFHRNAY